MLFLIESSYSLPSLIFKHTIADYTVSFCSAPGIAGIQLTRLRVKSSVIGLASSRAVRSSIMPALRILLVPKHGPLRNRVVPQSPQKCPVIPKPESATLVKVLGVPDVILKPSSGMIRLMLKLDPETLRQSRQWHRSWILLEAKNV